MIRKTAKAAKNSLVALRNSLSKKLKESVLSVLPITVLVIIVALSIGGVDGGIIGLFAVGAVLLILGMGLFTLGADVAMMPMGSAVGSTLSKSKKIWLIVLVCFVMGMLITIAEPDLQVLAGQLKSGEGVNTTLIIAVAVGVGAFLVLAALRTLFRIRLRYLLTGFYLLLFVLAAFVPDDFLAIAFDSGGVTTGPVTVPFLMSLGLGLAAVRGGQSSEEDSFGMVALCSIGPVLAVLILGLTGTADVSASVEEVPVINSFGDIMRVIGSGLPYYFREVAIALLPIVAVFLVFQFVAIRLPKERLIRILIGIVYTYFGLTIFLTGVNVGFMPLGKLLGETLGGRSYSWILIPLSAVMGALVVFAEPAVHVLNKQVEEITGGAISSRVMMTFLAVGIAAALALAMTRVLTGLSIWWILIPGYAISLLLTFFVPGIFTGIAFDSGGVASGPMTATFILPFAIGVCTAVGGNLFTDAFGLVAFVALAPLITIQILGLIYKIKTRRHAKPATAGDEEVVDFASAQFSAPAPVRGRARILDKRIARLSAIERRVQRKLGTLRQRRESLYSPADSLDNPPDSNDNSKKDKIVPDTTGTDKPSAAAPDNAEANADAPADPVRPEEEDKA